MESWKGEATVSQATSFYWSILETIIRACLHPVVVYHSYTAKQVVIFTRSFYDLSASLSSLKRRMTRGMQGRYGWVSHTWKPVIGLL